MIEDLARLILEAQRIREESWDATSESYALTIEDATHKAGETSGLDTRADWLVHILLVAAWIDAGMWASCTMMVPRYSHKEFEGMLPMHEATFLGQSDTYDLYIFRNNAGTQILLSIWGNGPAHSLVRTAKQIQLGHYSDLGMKEALALASEQGLLSK